MLAAHRQSERPRRDDPVARALARHCPSGILRDVGMAEHTTIGAGGPARYMALPRSATEVKGLVRAALHCGIDYMGIGRGSNLLVRDGGFDGLVIKLAHNLSALRVYQRTIYAEAGVSFTRLGKTAWKHRRPGLEFAIGIPGSVGGAVRMNAGAFGSEVARLLKSAKVVDERGRILVLTPETLQFRYRHSNLHPRAIVVSAIFHCPPGELDPAQLERTMVRKTTQPLSDRSFGSTFQNPRGGYAAQLIDHCGLKGYQLGGAMVSPKHANFIINVGDGTRANDVEDLVLHVQAMVLRKHGVRLQPEVVIIGTR